MGKTPKEKVYKKSNLQKIANGFRKLSGLAYSSKATIGVEMHLETIGGRIRALTYNFENPDTLPLLINIHGGGFVMGSPEMDDPYMMNVAENANVKILNIEYSLAPDEAFPKALDECYSVVEYAMEHHAELKIDKKNIALCGHSAGGNLCASICLMNSERKNLDIKCAILDYPPLDIYTDASLKPTGKRTLPVKLCRIFDASYCIDKENRKNPLISPIYANNEQLSAFPSTLIITAGKDSLCAEGERFRDMLDDAGVSVKHRRFEDAIHGFTVQGGPDSDEAWQMMIGFLKDNLND